MLLLIGFRLLDYPILVINPNYIHRSKQGKGELI